MIKNTIIIASALLAIAACSRVGINRQENLIQEADYRFTEGDVEVLFTEVQTKEGDGNTQTFLMEASDDGADIHLKSIVTSAVIGSSYTRLEHFTETGIFIGSLLIHEGKIVEVQYNAELEDTDLGAPATKGIFSKCVSEKYKTISDIIDSDGESKLLCDGTNILQLCNAAKVVASAIICIRNGK